MLFVILLLLSRLRIGPAAENRECVYMCVLEREKRRGREDRKKVEEKTSRKVKTTSQLVQVKSREDT